jgi:hypothetical protein
MLRLLAPIFVIYGIVFVLLFAVAPVVALWIGAPR